MTTLSYDIIWRDHGATRGMQKLGKETEQTHRKYAAWGKAAAVAGLVVAAAAVKFGQASVKAYGEAQQSQLRLQDAFRKFPKLADTNIGSLRGLNTELAKKTRFDDDATASGQAVLAQFQLTGKEITQLTPLLQDYAAKTGRDLPDAAKLLGKAMLGNGRALKDVGINFKDTGDRGQNFNQIMVGLRSQVGGFAQQEGKTAAGQIAILQNQFGELQEAVGEKLVPSLSKGVGMLTDFVGFIDENRAVVGPLAASIAGIAGSIGLVVAAAKGIRVVSAAFDTLSISAKGASIAAGGVGIALGIATLAIGHYAKKSAEAKAQTDSFTEALIASKGAIDGNVRSLAAKALADKGAFDNAQKLGISLEDVTNAALGNEPAMQRVMAAVNRYASAVDSADTKTQDQVDAANELADALLPVRQQFDNGKKAAGQFGQATETSTKKVDESRAALDKWRTSMFKAARAAIDLEGSQDAVEAAVDDATQSVKANGKTLDSNTEKGRSNRQSLRNLASASINYREKLIEQGASQKRVTSVTQDGRAEFVRTAVKMGATRKEAERLADKYGLLDRRINQLNDKKVTARVAFTAAGRRLVMKPGSLGGGVTAFAGGGYTGHHPPANVAGLVHGDEHVIRSASRRKFEAKYPGYLKAINETGDLPGYRGGGVVTPVIKHDPLINPGSLVKVIMDRMTAKIRQNAGNNLNLPMTGSGPAGSAIATGGWSSIYAALRRVGARNFTTYPGHDQGASRSRDITPPSQIIADTARRLSSIWYVIYNRQIASTTYGMRWRPYTRYGANATPSQAHTNHVHVTLRPGVSADMGGLLKSGGMAANLTGSPERVLSPQQTRSFDQLVKVISRNRGTSGGTTIIVNAPNYVGDKKDLVKALTDLDRQGRLAVVKR